MGAAGAADAVSDGERGRAAAGAWSVVARCAQKLKNLRSHFAATSALTPLGAAVPGGLWASLPPGQPVRAGRCSPASAHTTTASSRQRQHPTALLRAVNSAPRREPPKSPAPFPAPVAPVPSDWPPGSSQSLLCPGGRARRRRGGTCPAAPSGAGVGAAARQPLSPALPLAEACLSVTFGRRGSSPAAPFGSGTRLRDPHNSALGPASPNPGLPFCFPRNTRGTAWPPSDALLSHAGRRGTPGISGGPPVVRPQPTLPAEPHPLAGGGGRGPAGARKRGPGRGVCFQPSPSPPHPRRSERIRLEPPAL